MGKRGLAWPVENVDPTFMFTKPGSKISWLYNWSPNPNPNPNPNPTAAGCSSPSSSSSALEFVPMQWNHVDIELLADRVAGASARAVLGFNEPDHAEQANMSPAVAAEYWVRWIEPLRRGRPGGEESRDGDGNGNGTGDKSKRAAVRCVSPGITSAPSGVAWLSEFLRLIRERGSDVDAYSLHWYGETLGQFYDYIWSAYYQLGPTKPVWITEYAPTNWSIERPLDRAHVENFARESCKYLDSLDWVERYAFFGAMRDTGTVGKWAAMIDGEGKLTELGRIYRDS